MRTRTRSLALAAILTLSWPLGAAADTILVRQDGTGDATTITGALQVAADGDVILVGAGTFDEMPTVTVDVTIRAEMGAGTTILDGADTHGIMTVDDGAVVALEDLVFTRASAPGSAHGAALLVWNGSQVEARGCEFTDNHSAHDNGAIHARHAGTVVTAIDCRFVGNTAAHNGGACGVGWDAAMTLSGCTFRDNASLMGGACAAYFGASLDIDGCLFVENTGVVGAVLVEGTKADITGSTFHANVSLEHATVLYYAGSSGSFVQNIVAEDQLGFGLKLSFPGACTHDCNIYDANTAGALDGDELGDFELTVPALFCAADAGDFSLCADSPALPESNVCGLIGAFGQGCDACGVVMTESHSWTTVKQLFD